MKQLCSILALGGALTLAACGGADDVASPGEGTLVASTTPTPTGTPTPTPTPTAPTTAVPADCPTGTTNVGVITSPSAGQLRNCQLSGRISSNLILRNIANTIYSLSGVVDVGTDVGGDGLLTGGNPVSLTIEPGVVVFASAGLDYLVVNRGSKLFAEGSPSKPIIFTARANVDGTATDDSQGLWGGIILLGRAPISDCNTAVAGGSANCQNVIEGTTGSLYGGNVPTDNSGVLRYVQIRYSGFAIAPGNELQSLTTGGVGSGTTIDHIQSHNSSDDGVEFFGGRQNVKYLVVTGADDDGLDTDLGYKGFIQFVISIQRPGGASGDSMIEADSNGNEDALPRQNTRLANFTFVHRSAVAASVNAILLRGGTDYTMVNGVVTSTRTCLDIDETGGTTTRAANAALDDVGPPVFRSVVLTCTTAAFQEDGNVPSATVSTIFGSGTNNNNSAFISTLTGGFINGANETAVTAFNAATLDPFLTTTNYIGAVQNASDTWYVGWTCSSATASFGTASGTCTTIPAIRP